MRADVFLDTNVLIYAFALDDSRASTAEALLGKGGVVSVQVLNEFTSVAIRKLHMPWREVREALDVLRVLCPSCLPLTLATHESAVVLAEAHALNIYDALIVAAALEAGCTTLYSEDLQDGWLVEKRLRIRNPFRATA